MAAGAACRMPAIAARLREEPPRGLSITVGEPTRSLRSRGDQLVVCEQLCVDGYVYRFPQAPVRAETSRVLSCCAASS